MVCTFGGIGEVSLMECMYQKNDPNSIDDKDVQGIVLPPREYYYGLKTFGSKGTQEIFKGEWDIVLYEFTKATPDDVLSFIGRPPIILPKGEKVYISCTFTWDKPKSEYLAKQWQHFGYNVDIVGPAYDTYPEEFTPGLFLKQGYVITTRGCPNKCSFCFVPKREGPLRCLEIKDGHNILDNNLLAAPKEHILSVFTMLQRQKEPIKFTGGIEARRVDDWFVNLLSSIKLGALFLAYDTEAEKEPVYEASLKLTKAGFTRNHLYCYVLCGHKEDTIDKAKKRVQFIKSLNVTPFAMLYRNKECNNRFDQKWKTFIRQWTRPAAIWSKHSC